HRVMDRRAFITVMGGSILGVPLVSDAQQAAKMPRLGYLLLPPLSETPSPERAAFLARLRDLGWIDGKTIAIEYRSANWTVELLAQLDDELIRMKVDIMFATGWTAPTMFPWGATTTILIIISACPDSAGQCVA